MANLQEAARNGGFFHFEVVMSVAEQSPGPRATHVAHAWLSAPVYRMLEIEAQRRRLLPDQLAARILEAALVNDDVDTLLAR
jgi:hypothetical protein